MNISVKEITSVDKELTLTANREDLQDTFDKAYKKYKNQIAMPGFRPGKVPLTVVKKRFGKEIELEEINNYVQRVYEKDIVPEYAPVGETEMLDLKWENDELEVVFKIGAKPEFELKDLKKIKVNKMVHDVTDEEVEEEIERTLEREGTWEDVDTKATKDSKLIVDVISLDADGNPVDGEEDTDQVIDLRQDGAKDFLKSLKGKKTGDVVDMELGDGDETDRFRVTIKKVQKLEKAEMNEEFITKNSNGEAKTEDEFKSFLKSQMQKYYDQSTDDMLKNELVEALVEAHEVEVPEVFLEQILNAYVEQLKQQQGGKLPANFDEVVYKEEMRERGLNEAKWSFISQKLQESFEDIEIKPEDIDEFISAEAARYGATADQLKQYYAQNPNMLEQLRSSIRENKVFEKLEDEVKITEVDKEKYRKMREKKSKK
ncbi:trigger factor [Balneola vulgaris]|uniref:trigger factor n=1 Tax=Balneola vulgaris TaxID=287535 RepID=UPI0003735602|nr:trigger factor [Balneola vulgaris]